MVDTYIKVRVIASAKRNQVKKENDIFHISVKEKTQEGRANKEVRRLLAETLNCKESQLRLIKGHKTPSKTYLLM